MLVLSQKEPILNAIIKICIKIHKNVVFLTSPGQIWSDGIFVFAYPSTRHRQSIASASLLLCLVLASQLCGNHLHRVLAIQYTNFASTWNLKFVIFRTLYMREKSHISCMYYEKDFWQRFLAQLNNNDSLDF